MRDGGAGSVPSLIMNRRLCLLQEKPKDGRLTVGSDNLLFRWEFLEALVRISIAKFGKGVATQSPAEAIDMLVAQHLEPHVPAAARVDLNHFRTTRLYCEAVDDMFKKHEAVLRALYSRWRLRPPSGGLRTKARPHCPAYHLTAARRATASRRSRACHAVTVTTSAPAFRFPAVDHNWLESTTSRSRRVASSNLII